MQREEVAVALHQAGGHALSKRTPPACDCWYVTTLGQLWYQIAHASNHRCRLLLDGSTSWLRRYTDTVD